MDPAGRDGERQQGAKSRNQQDHAATAPSATRRRHRHVTRCPREQARPELSILAPPATDKVIPEQSGTHVLAGAPFPGPPEASARRFIASRAMR